MKHKDFKIGHSFYLNNRKYLCTDMGKRTIIAVQADYTDVTTSRNGRTSTRKQILTPKLIGNPPYWLAEIVFDEYDIEIACLKKR
jgi:hypothetical protein